MIEQGHATHTGLRREHNEDAYWADAAGGLWLVADGMGGHARGEVASALALDTLLDALRTGADLAAAFRDAGAAVAAHPHQRRAATPMGTTLAALRLCGADGYEAARVGDSRIYVWQHGSLTRLARMPRPEPEGDDEPPTAPPHNAATQALGITPSANLAIDPYRGQLAPGMQFLVCSDGLTDELSDGALARILSRTDLAAQECVDQLVLAALDAGGRDNITAVLVRVS